MKYKSLIIISFIWLSCNSKSQELAGTYKSSKLKFTEKLNYGTNKDINGLTLILKKDSSYHYDTCGLLIDGSWKVRNDSLIMSVSNIRFANDSINNIRTPEIRDDFLKYQIENDILYGFINENNSLRINKLIKKN
jgi:hypothetical protein